MIVTEGVTDMIMYDLNLILFLLYSLYLDRMGVTGTYTLKRPAQGKFKACQSLSLGRLLYYEIYLS